MFTVALKNLNFSANKMNKSQSQQLPGQGVVTAPRTKSADVADILAATQTLRSGNLKSPSKTLLQKTAGKASAYAANKKDVAANKKAFAELAPQSAVTPKAVNTQPSVDSILADSLAVRDGLYKGPSLGAKILNGFASLASALKGAVVGFGSGVASLVGAITGAFAKMWAAMTKTSKTNKASQELVGNAFVQETAGFVAQQKNAKMKLALAEAENFALSQLIEGKVVADLATQAVELKSTKN